MRIAGPTGNASCRISVYYMPSTPLIDDVFRSRQIGRWRLLLIYQYPAPCGVKQGLWVETTRHTFSYTFPVPSPCLRQSYATTAIDCKTLAA